MNEIEWDMDRVLTREEERERGRLRPSEALWWVPQACPRPLCGEPIQVDSDAMGIEPPRWVCPSGHSGTCVEVGHEKVSQDRHCPTCGIRLQESRRRYCLAHQPRKRKSA